MALPLYIIRGVCYLLYNNSVTVTSSMSWPAIMLLPIHVPSNNASLLMSSSVKLLPNHSMQHRTGTTMKTVTYTVNHRTKITRERRRLGKFKIQNECRRSEDNLFSRCSS